MLKKADGEKSYFFYDRCGGQQKMSLVSLECR